MQTRILGKSGLEVSAIGFGCMGLNFGYGQGLTSRRASSSSARLRARRHLLRHRGNLRPLHQRGDGRRGARAVPRQGRDRDQVRLPHRSGDRKSRASTAGPAHIRAAVEGSLKRLKIEVIDLFYQHRVDPNMPIEEVGRDGEGR